MYWLIVIFFYNSNLLFMSSVYIRDWHTTSDLKWLGQYLFLHHTVCFIGFVFSKFVLSFFSVFLLIDRVRTRLRGNSSRIHRNSICNTKLLYHRFRRESILEGMRLNTHLLSFCNSIVVSVLIPRCLKQM